MTGLQKGLLVAVVQLVIVLTVAGKYATDRRTLPRAWALVTPYDPNLPVRGRYVSLAVHAIPAGTFPANFNFGMVKLTADNGRLGATQSDGPSAVPARFDTASSTIVLGEAIAFFIAEHVPDPSRRPPGEELWAELSIPRKGPPRPVRLGMKKNGVLTPLALE